MAFLLLFIYSKDSKACSANPSAMIQTLGSMCHSCMLPLSVGGVQIVSGPMPDSTRLVTSPVCACPFPPPIFVRIGIPVSFFEPSRLIEVVSEPYCFPAMGLSTGLGNGLLGGKTNREASSQNTFMQAHYMMFAPYALMELMTDFICVESVGLDIAYITEPDPLWNSDTLGFIINPEALLFGNPITNLSCVADSISSSVYTPLEPLFWCMGSWGNAYPLTGHKPTSGSFAQDSIGIASKLIYKLHRQLILWGSFGEAGLCNKFPMPIWRKAAYRLQPIVPIPHPIATSIGQTGLMWDAGKTPPMNFDNFGYLLFKKRDCCAF